MIDTEFSLSRELIGFAEATVKSLIQPTRSNKSPPYGIINILRNYCAGRVKESDVVCEIKEAFDDHVDYVFRKRMQNARHTPYFNEEELSKALSESKPALNNLMLQYIESL